MKQKLNLEEVLKYDPYRTYLGSGYRDDVITCSNVQFLVDEEKGITADLSFRRSFLAESQQGFHLSAMNVQVLVPFLCEQLVKAQLAYRKEMLTDFLIMSSEQHYKQFITEQDRLRCVIKHVATRGHEYAFEYGFSVADRAQPAFLGKMLFAAKVEHTPAAIYIPATMQVQAEEAYKLKDVWCDEQQLSVAGLLVNKAKRLAPVQVHGAVGLLMKGLFCQLLQMDRQQTMDARAYQIVQHYDLRIPTEKKISVTLQLDREMHLSVKDGEEWGFFTARYEVGEVMEGVLRIANPMKGIEERQKERLQDYFTPHTSPVHTL